MEETNWKELKKQLQFDDFFSNFPQHWNWMWMLKITFQTFRIVFVHHLSFVLGNAAPRSVMSTSPNLIEDGQKPNSLFGCGIQIILTFNLLFIWMIFLLDSRKFNLVLTAAAFKKIYEWQVVKKRLRCALEKLIGVKSESGELISEQVVKCYQNYECLKENANDKMRFSVNH